MTFRTNESHVSLTVSRDSGVDIDDLGLEIRESRDQRWPTGFATQFRMLTWRNYKQSKSRIFEFHDLVHFAILAAIAGILFFQISKTATVFKDRMGLVSKLSPFGQKCCKLA